MPGFQGSDMQCPRGKPLPEFESPGSPRGALRPACVQVQVYQKPLSRPGLRKLEVYAGAGEPVWRDGLPLAAWDTERPQECVGCPPRPGGGRGSAGSPSLQPGGPATLPSGMALAGNLCAGGRSTSGQASGCCRCRPCWALETSGVWPLLRAGFCNWGLELPGGAPTCKAGQAVWEAGSGWDLPAASWDGWRWCPWGPRNRRLQKPRRPGTGLGT